MVQEKYCDSALLGAWKLPTGFIQEVIVYDIQLKMCYHGPLLNVLMAEF